MVIPNATGCAGAFEIVTLTPQVIVAQSAGLLAKADGGIACWLTVPAIRHQINLADSRISASAKLNDSSCMINHWVVTLVLLWPEQPAALPSAMPDMDFYAGLLGHANEHRYWRCSLVMAAIAPVLMLRRSGKATTTT